jgi:hypothetical protein
MQAWSPVPNPPAIGAAPPGINTAYGTVTALQDGRVLADGGVFGFPESTANSLAIASPRQSQGVVMLTNGTVLIVGGVNDTSSATLGVATAEVYDSTANTWTLSGAMVTARQFVVLNALPDGRILLDAGSPNAAGLPEFYK